jgi:type IV secretion system protein TrbB
VQPRRFPVDRVAHAGERQTADRLTPTQIESLIGTVAALLGTVVHGRAPIVEGELPINGYRFEGILPPVSTAPTFVIRKSASQVYSLEDYAKSGVMTSAQLEVCRDAIRARHNIVIAGGTASGKTTLANALMREIVAGGDPAERIVILEDTRELQCEAPNAVQLHTGDVADLTRLVRVTMRLRPDRIIVGEVRGGEALALLKAWNTGHPGGITTVHANSAAAALLRLESLIQESGVPPQPRLVAEAVDLVAFIVRTPEGRRIRELARVSAYDVERGNYVLEPVCPISMEVGHA